MIHILRPKRGLHDRPPNGKSRSSPQLSHLLISGAPSICDTHRHQTSVRPKESSEFVRDKDTINNQTRKHIQFQVYIFINNYHITY